MRFPVRDKWMEYRSHQVKSSKVNVTVLLALVCLLLNLVLLILHQTNKNLAPPPPHKKNNINNTKYANNGGDRSQFRKIIIDLRLLRKWNDQMARKTPQVVSKVAVLEEKGKKGGKAKNLEGSERRSKK